MLEPAREVSFGHFDREPCVQALEQFFRRYATVGDDFATWWRAEHHAFGLADDVIQYSWELEGTSDRILLYYRPEHLDDAEWIALSLDERIEALRRSHGDAWRQFAFGSPSQLAKGTRLPHLVRTSDAPAFLVQELKREVGSVTWETVCASHTSTADELLEQAVFVQENLGGGFHWHVTFRPDARYADQLTELFAQGNEYTTLRMIGRSPARLHHNFVGPYSTLELDAIRQSVQSGGTPDYKFFSFSARSGYDAADRMGVEIRAIKRDLDVARRAIANVIRFLEDPDGAAIGFGARTSGYRIADVIGVDRLSPSTVERFPDDVRAFLRSAADAASHRGGYGPAGGFGRPILERWGLPMVRWEERSYLPGSVASEIEPARAELIARLRELAAQYAQAGQPTDSQAQDVIENLIGAWARRTQLWSYF